MLSLNTWDSTIQSKIELTVQANDDVKATAKERGINRWSLFLMPVTIGTRLVSTYSVGEYFVISCDNTEALMVCRVVSKDRDDDTVRIQVNIEGISDQDRYFHRERRQVFLSVLNDSEKPMDERVEAPEPRPEKRSTPIDNVRPLRRR